MVGIRQKRRRTPCLMAINPADPDSRLFTLTKSDCSIGSDESNDFVIRDDTVSRRHATIRRRRRRWELIDLGSTNGTFVNNSRISGAALLRDGQDVRFGSARLVFRRTAPSQLKGARTFRPSLYRRFFRVRTAIELIIVAFVVGFAVTQYLSYVNYRHLAETRSSASKLAPSPGPPPVSKATPVREAPPIRRGPPESSVSDKVPSWLKRLNYWRTMANMPAVSENLELSEGARRHSRYLVKHALQGDSGWLQGADMHSEDSRDPWYTPAGLAAGKNGDVDPPCQGCLLISDVQHLDIFLDAPFHRFRALDPDAREEVTAVTLTGPSRQLR